MRFPPLSKRVIVFPKSLKTDEEGFEFLSSLLHQTAEEKHFVLDFQDVTWFEANLCAVLGAIIASHKKLYKTKFTLDNLNYHYLRKTLENNKFLERVKDYRYPAEKTSAVPFSAFDMQNEDEVENYIFDFVLLKQEVPNMSKAAKKKIYRSIFELYQNSVQHSAADRVYVCGQFYNYKKRMALTMVEVGKTFEQNVKQAFPEFKDKTSVECIDWAVQSGNTTKPESETGGLGLDLIREFLKLNQGKLQIRSGCGYWEEKKGITNFQDSSTSFNGTIVNIEFNLRDTNQYYSREEINIKDVL